MSEFIEIILLILIVALLSNIDRNLAEFLKMFDEFIRK